MAVDGLDQCTVVPAASPGDLLCSGRASAGHPLGQGATLRGRVRMAMTTHQAMQCRLRICMLIEGSLHACVDMSGPSDCF